MLNVEAEQRDIKILKRRLLQNRATYKEMKDKTQLIHQAITVPRISIGLASTSELSSKSPSIPGLLCAVNSFIF